MQLGQHDAAKQAYLRVLAAGDGAEYRSRSAFRIGEIARMTGQTAEAELALRQFLCENPHDPLSPAANSLLGDIAAEEGYSAKAIALYQTAINEETDSGSVVQSRLGMARVLLASGQPNQVPVTLGSLTQSEDSNIKLEALLLRGRAEYDAHQYERSLKTFRLASRLPVANSLVNRARLAAGWSLWKLARNEEIAEEIGQIPLDALLATEYHYLLGMMAYSKKDWTTAIGEFTQAVAEPTSSFHDAALYYLGESCLQSEQFHQAKQWDAILIDNHGDSQWADDAVWTLIQIARKSGDREEFEQASALLRSRYPRSEYLPLLAANPWIENSNDNLPAAGTSGTATFEEAVAFEREGHFDAALAAYSDLISAEGETTLRPEALWRIARLHERLKQRSESASVYKRLLADFPSFDRSAEALINLARLKADLGEQAIAENLHKELLEKFPQSPQADEAAYWLALAAADVKDSETAHTYIELILESWNQQEEATGDRHNLIRGQALCLKCQLDAEDGRWPEIRKLLNSHDWKSETGPISSRLSYWEAESDFRLGEYIAARKKYENIQLLTVGLAEPWIPMVPLRLAQLASRQQQWKQVLELVKDIDVSYPEFELAYEADYLRGRALAGLGQMSKARGAYQEVLQNELTSGLETAAMAQWMIGETYFHQCDYENAHDAYKQVMLKHRFPEWQARAALQAGKCAELKGRWQEAIQLYRQALESWQDSEVADQLSGRLEWSQRQATLEPSTLLN
nr:tetratricopeptide repeat protein [Bythopirellula goksoeyrii]